MKSLHNLLLGTLLTAGATGPVMAGESGDSETKSEYELALSLTPNIERGRQLYLNCVSCHGPEGWGNANGTYPQIAGQLAGVIIKQLQDIRRGNRSNPIMQAFTSERVLGGAQDIADVAGYVASMPMTSNNGKGKVQLLEQGKVLYEENCAQCHGDEAEGDSKDLVPLLQAQHYRYQKRQFDHIRKGLRRNADEKMTKQIKGFDYEEEAAVLSYAASLLPPKEKLAASGWRNNDFPHFRRPPPPPRR